MLSFKDFLIEGGGYGHLDAPHHTNLKFSEMADIISQALRGELHYAEEKTDAVNLMFSVRNGQIYAARNKTHLKNYGENALDADAIFRKFSGRPLAKAYKQAVDDLQSAIGGLSRKQQEKIFANGRKWMSIEVIGLGAENIIPYGVNELRLHGTFEYGPDGEKVSGINKADAKMLDGMIRQIKAHQQKAFAIKKLSRVSLPKIPDYKKLEAKYTSHLKSTIAKYGLKMSDDLNTYRARYWEEIIDKKGLDVDPRVREMLINRWAYQLKSPSITNIYSMAPDHKDKIKEIEGSVQKLSKDLIHPFDSLFIQLGNDVISAMTELMALNPSKAADKMRKNLDNAINKVKSSENKDLIKKLETELERLNLAGNQVFPTEGITFFYKDKFLKLTGTFGPINQIMGLLFRL